MMRKLILTLAALLTVGTAQAEAIHYEWTVKPKDVMYAEPETDNVWFNMSCVGPVVQAMFILEKKYAKKIAPASDYYTTLIGVGPDKVRLVGRFEPDEINSTHVFISILTMDSQFLTKMTVTTSGDLAFGPAKIKLEPKSANGIKAMLKNCKG